MRHGFRVVRCVACGAEVRIAWLTAWPVECECGLEYTPRGEPSPEPICPGLPRPPAPPEQAE